MALNSNTTTYLAFIAGLNLEVQRPRCNALDHKMYYNYPEDVILDPYSLLVSTIPDGSQNMTATERFELVSSLYGPGNLVCWFLLLISVVVGWTLNPASARRDTISNDYIAVLTMPIVAVAHFFHQIYQQRGNSGDESLNHFFGSLDRDDVRSVAAIEAPLSVCENFIAWAAVLYFLAARRNQFKRMAAVLAVGSLCLVAELVLWFIDVGCSSLVRPYLFQWTALWAVYYIWHLLMLVVYLLEVVFGILVTVAHIGRREVESAPGAPSAVRRILWPGRVSSWMSAYSAVVVGTSSIWIKYGSMYPADWRFHAFRFIPKSIANISDLDQVVAALGGFITLLFSARETYKQRRIRAAQRHDNRQARDGDGRDISLQALSSNPSLRRAVLTSSRARIGTQGSSTAATTQELMEGRLR